MNAISVRGLGKRFKLFASPSRRFLEYLSAGRIAGHSDFWALQDISFEVPPGTTLGILGQNGSGKSTLLSILAGVLYPSAGSFEINGKVSAILELGSGFHPEFSGRDNVYMYGSIMGLSKQEIDERYDEIVRFSELGDFIDQPLRTYSSGMVVRLAFSVAVNVNADILIVDEALAVGDAIFQHRCFRKIREMQEAGKTILYVGHDTEAVRNLCTQALLLDGGRIIDRGNPNTVVNTYYSLIAEREQSYAEKNLSEHGTVPGPEYETLYDFTRNLDKATIGKGTSPVTLMTTEVSSVPKPILIAHPPSSIQWTVSYEEGSFLTFAIGILPEAYNRIAQGIKFDIDLLMDDTTKNIFTRMLQPQRNLGDRGWHNFIIPLEASPGKKSTVKFSTSGIGNDLSYAWSAWGWPVLKKRSMETRPDDLTLIRKPENIMEGHFSGAPIRYGNRKIEIIHTEICDATGRQKSVFMTNEPAIVRITIKSNEDIDKEITVGCSIRNRYSIIYGMNTYWQNNNMNHIGTGVVTHIDFSCCLRLGDGYYSVTPAVAIVHSATDIEILDRLEDQILFKIINSNPMEGFVDLDAIITWHQ